MPATMPVATPLRSWCVVGTFTRATSSRVAASIATTSVKVPPTSIPTRSFLKSAALPIGDEHDGGHDQLDATLALIAIENDGQIVVQPARVGARRR